MVVQELGDHPVHRFVVAGRVVVEEHSVHTPDEEAAVGGMALPQGDHERQVIRGEGRAVLIARDERGRPFLHRNGPRVLKPKAEHSFSRLVEVEERAGGIHQKDGDRQVAGKLPGQNELHFFLGRLGTLPQRALALCKQASACRASFPLG
jgi:hypothetical protein